MDARARPFDKAAQGISNDDSPSSSCGTSSLSSSSVVGEFDGTNASGGRNADELLAVRVLPDSKTSHHLASFVRPSCRMRVTSSYAARRGPHTMSTGFLQAVPPRRTTWRKSDSLMRVDKILSAIMHCALTLARIPFSLSETHWLTQLCHRRVIRHTHQGHHIHFLLERKDLRRFCAAKRTWCCASRRICASASFQC